MALLRGLAAILRAIVDLSSTGLIRRTGAGTVDTVGTSDDLQLGQVGLGVAPLYPVHVQGGIGSGATPSADYDDVVIDIQATGGLSIVTPDASNANIAFGSPSDRTNVILQWDGANQRLNFGSYTSGGEVRLRTGNGSVALNLQSDSRIAIGTTAAAGAQLRVEQTSASGNIPVLILDQDDSSEEFIRFEGLASHANVTNCLVAAGDVSTATLEGYTKIYVYDTGNQITDAEYFMPFYSLT